MTIGLDTLHARKTRSEVGFDDEDVSQVGLLSDAGVQRVMAAKQ
jgi:hypothetical protein